MKQQLTAHRQTVYDVVKASHDHPTARQVFQRALERSPQLSFATVYNSLKYLTDHGMVRQVSFGEDAVRYDAMMARHDHIVCRKCHRVDDLVDLTPPSPDKRLPTGFKLEEVTVSFLGVCKYCQHR